MAQPEESPHHLLEVSPSRISPKASSLFRESVGDGIIGTDDRGEIQVFNRVAEQLLGYSKDEVIGRTIQDVLRVPASSFPSKEPLPPAGLGGEFAILNKQDMPVKLHITHAGLVVHNQRPVESVFVLREMTNEEAVENLKANFLASIPHEFRTPLAAINACVELLLEEQAPISTDETCELLNSIQMSVSGLQALIDNLLESMNIEADQFKIRWQLTDLHQVIADAVHSVNPLLKRREQNIALHLEDPIPLVEADPGRLTQAIVNLLSNASKYSPIGEPIELHVEVEDREWVRVAVADRGTGIPTSEHSEIFQPFGHRRRPDEPQFGIGLGLPIVKAIVDAHGGTVGVDTCEGAGSVFWFKLPYNIRE